MRPRRSALRLQVPQRNMIACRMVRLRGPLWSLVSPFPSIIILSAFQGGSQLARADGPLPVRRASSNFQCARPASSALPSLGHVRLGGRRHWQVRRRRPVLVRMNSTGGCSHDGLPGVLSNPHQLTVRAVAQSRPHGPTRRELAGRTLDRPTVAGQCPVCCWQGPGPAQASAALASPGDGPSAGRQPRRQPVPGVLPLPLRQCSLGAASLALEDGDISPGPGAP
jgi:hypothetical protein